MYYGKNFKNMILKFWILILYNVIEKDSVRSNVKTSSIWLYPRSLAIQFLVLG